MDDLSIRRFEAEREIMAGRYTTLPARAIAAAGRLIETRAADGFGSGVRLYSFVNDAGVRNVWLVVVDSVTGEFSEIWDGSFDCPPLCP